MSLTNRFSFNNFFQSSVMFMDPSECLLMGTNYFSDPMGNVLNIEFEENLMAVRKYFGFRVFDIDWNEIEYPLVEPSVSGLRSSFSCSPRFFQSFRVKLELSKPYILLLEEFQKFCEEQLKLDRKVQLYDPIYKKFELYLDTNIDGIIILFSLTEFMKYYGFNEDDYLHLNYIGNNVFLHKIYFADGVEMIYERELVSGLNNDSGGIVNNVDVVNPHDFLNSHHGLVKKLTKYAVQTSSLYLHSNFARQFLENGRRRYFITISTPKFWPCRIRWTRRSSFECYMTCGWKRFCKDNQLAVGDELKFVIDNQQKNVIHVLKSFQRVFNWFDSSPEKSLMMLVYPEWDPLGNYIMVEFEDSFMESRSFRIARELANFYKLNDLYWLAILYCGDRYFQFHIFSLPMKEIDYPASTMVPIPQQPLSSSRLLTCFESELLVFEIILPNWLVAVIQVDLANFYHSMAKCLSAHDIKSSSLYLESDFAAKALVKNRKRHLLINVEGDCWPCTIRWSDKTNRDCYITRG
ncbi:hypothetical protein DEO72_LG5g770 [Vigna unguiculata]|uniref:TF-B3 domain-containing protein n=1 Tax=Vigna unguiculata TaxID=3917 RepID=A0A4D6LUT7_VIGUN|nr:hypothetical protein DEO72_LG5g770 [Vigna unguiculata]